MERKIAAVVLDAGLVTGGRVDGAGDGGFPALGEFVEFYGLRFGVVVHDVVVVAVGVGCHRWLG